MMITEIITGSFMFRVHPIKYPFYRDDKLKRKKMKKKLQKKKLQRKYQNLYLQLQATKLGKSKRS